jgi:hypothetical protein
MNNGVVNITYKYLCGHGLVLGKHLGVELLGHMVDLCFMVFCFCFCFAVLGFELRLVRKALFHLSHSASLFYVGFFFEIGPRFMPRLGLD